VHIGNNSQHLMHSVQPNNTPAMGILVGLFFKSFLLAHHSKESETWHDRRLRFILFEEGLHRAGFAVNPSKFDVNLCMFVSCK